MSIWSLIRRASACGVGIRAPFYRSRRSGGAILIRAPQASERHLRAELEEARTRPQRTGDKRPKVQCRIRLRCDLIELSRRRQSKWMGQHRRPLSCRTASAGAPELIDCALLSLACAQSNKAHYLDCLQQAPFWLAGRRRAFSLRAAAAAAAAAVDH